MRDSNCTFSELVEIDEELSDSNSIFGDNGLKSFLHIEFAVHERSLFLLGRWVETIHNGDSYRTYVRQKDYETYFALYFEMELS